MSTTTTSLWTIQPANVLETIQARGVARVDRRQLLSVPNRYKWLTSQLRRRLPGWTGRLPWWFYGYKPDLRRHRHAWASGQELVRIEIEIDAARVFSFPAWAWHLVYCGDYLPPSVEEYREWRRALRKVVPREDAWPLPQPWKTRLERSWERLFDPLPLQPWPGLRRFDPWLSGRLEAVAEKILADDVWDARPFRGASRDEALLFYERHKAERLRRRLAARERKR